MWRRCGLGSGSWRRHVTGMVSWSTSVGAVMACHTLRQQKHPAWLDEVGVGQRLPVGLRFPLIELIDLVPAFAIPEIPLGKAAVRRLVCGNGTAVSKVVLTRAAANAWTGAMTGSRGA